MAYNRLFVVIDSAREEQPALTRATALLGDSGGHIHGFCAVHEDLLPEDSPYPPGKQELLESAEVKLEDLLEPLASSKVTVETEVQWSAHRERAAVRACTRMGADLLITCLPSTPGRGSFHYLLRHNPSPVLLVRAEDSRAYKVILAALALEDNDRRHDSLNNSVIAQAQRICRTYHATLHTVSALEGTPNIAQLLKITENEDAEKLSGEEMISQSFGIDRTNVHIDYGPAKAVIRETATRIGADLLVMGTIARTGLSGALIGNTCEKVLAALPMDVLTVS